MNLPGADIEVAAIQERFTHVSVLQGKDATKAALRTQADLSQAHALHFACHGLFIPLEEDTLYERFEVGTHDSLGSALILAKAEHLTLAEIFELTLPHCRLVTLSACETVLVDPRGPGDEYIGLPSGFLFAGSPCVVSSFWKTSDHATPLFMAKFYDTLMAAWEHEGPNASVACTLNSAQRWLRDATGEDLNTFVDGLSLTDSQHRMLKAWLDTLKQEHNASPLRALHYWAAFAAIGA